MREATAAIDAVWLHMDEPTNPMVVTAVLWFDTPVDPERFARLIQDQMIAKYPRFSQRVLEPTSGLGALWEADPAFALDRHLLRVRLPAPGGREELEELVSDVMSEPLPHDRALWLLHLVEGYRGGSAVIARMHHALADGFALASVLLSLSDTPSEGSPPGVHAHLALPRTLAQRAEAAPKAIAALGKLVFAPPDPLTPLKGPLGLRKRAAWSGTWSLQSVKDRAHALDCTVNDLLMAALSGALRRWLGRHGALPRAVRAFVPVDLRAPGPIPATLGNRFGLVYLKLPVSCRTPERRLAVTRRRMETLKRSPEALVAFGLLDLFGRIPEGLEGVLVDFMGAKGSLVATNLPGPRQPVSLAGVPISGMRFWVPQAGHMALGISILSYSGGIGIGVASDAGVIADPASIVDDFADELAAYGVDPPV